MTEPPCIPSAELVPAPPSPRRIVRRSARAPTRVVTAKKRGCRDAPNPSDRRRAVRVSALRAGVGMEEKSPSLLCAARGFVGNKSRWRAARVQLFYPRPVRWGARGPRGLSVSAPGSDPRARLAQTRLHRRARRSERPRDGTARALAFEDPHRVPAPLRPRESAVRQFPAPEAPRRPIGESFDRHEVLLHGLGTPQGRPRGRAGDRHEGSVAEVPPRPHHRHPVQQGAPEGLHEQVPAGHPSRGTRVDNSSPPAPRPPSAPALALATDGRRLAPIADALHPPRPRPLAPVRPPRSLTRSSLPTSAPRLSRSRRRRTCTRSVST